MGKTLITLSAALLTTVLAAPTMPGWLSSAAGHIGEPTIKGLRFPGSRPEAPWYIVDNVGLLALDGDWRWLCDEAISPVPGLEDLAPLDAEGQIWLAATRGGLRRTTDGGCTFAPVPGFEAHAVGHLSPDPSRPGHAVVGTTTIGGPPNEIYRTTDGGESWRPAGLGIEGRVRGVLRAEADPDVIYVIHTTGALRSDDGGQSFTPIELAPPPAEGARPPSGTDIGLLATDPRDPMTVWSAFVRFPESDLQRSRDGGLTWQVMAAFPDDPRSLVIEPTTGELLLAMALEGLRRSTDDGQSWDVVFLPEPNAWIDCLTRGPDGALWACVRRNAPYSVARSDDFGDTWTGRFASDFSEIGGGWRCPGDSDTAAACAAACDRATEDCSAGPSATDGGAPDSGPLDGGPPADGGGSGGEIPTTSDESCRASPGRSTPGPLGALGVLLLGGLIAGRRRAA